GSPCLVKVDSRTEALLSSFIREKSGAESPTRRAPARACVHKVSKGRMRNATGSGIRAINRANVSGGCRMISYSAPHASIHANAITAKARTNALLTNLGCVLKVSSFTDSFPTGALEQKVRCQNTLVVSGCIRLRARFHTGRSAVIIGRQADRSIM